MSENEDKPTTLAQALLRAQMEMPAVEPDGTNPHYKSRFVTLGHLIAKVRPVLNRNGIAVAQFPSADKDGKPSLVTLLIHESGEQIEFAAPLLLPKNDPQGQGSAITYLRRYALASALGISDQEDDDGNAGSTGAVADGQANGGQSEPKPSEKQVDFLVSLLAQAGVSGSDQDAVKSYAMFALTGGNGGSVSRIIDRIKNQEDEKVIPTLVAAARKRDGEQQDVPVDRDGLPDVA